MGQCSDADISAVDVEFLSGMAKMEFNSRLDTRFVYFGKVSNRIFASSPTAIG